MSFNSAVFDSTCSSTVYGIGWIECYLETLTVEDIVKLERKRVQRVSNLEMEK